MKKRISAGILVLSMCLAFLQPVAGLAVDMNEPSIITSWQWECEDGVTPPTEKESGWVLDVPISGGRMPDRGELGRLLPTKILATLEIPEATGDTEKPNPDVDSTGDSIQETEPIVSVDGEDHSGAPGENAGTSEPTEPAESGNSTNPGTGDGASAPNGESLPGGEPEGNGDSRSEPAGLSNLRTSQPGGDKDANGSATLNLLVVNGTENGADDPAEPSAEPVELKLTWDLNGYSEENSAAEGGPQQLTLTATLPAGYELSTDAPELSLTVIFSEAELVPATERLLADNTVEGIEIPGTVVNMFDYWAHESGRYGTEGKEKFSDYDYARTIKGDITSQGINKQRTLIFSGGTTAPKLNKPTGNSYNYWYENDPYAPFSYRPENLKSNTKLVTRTLQDGYPAILLDWANNPKKPPQSLDYLFDPDTFEGGSKPDAWADYKSAFPNVTGLFQLDEDGYYYYDARKNYAYLNEETKEITLYNAPGGVDKPQWLEDGGGVGQFFPFDDPLDQNIFLEDPQNPGRIIANTEKQPNIAGNTFNHYFGMTMTTRFKQINGGETWRGDPITYEFAGDDDVWLYIDGVLMADLGGLHNSASFSINFQTGSIVVKGEDEQEYLNTTIKGQFEAAGKDASNKGDWNGNTFADNTYHTLQFFYLERGNSASNLKLRFNLHPIPESELLKVDQGDQGIAGAEFALYAADEDYKYNESAPLYTGATDGKGHLPLKDKTGAPISFQQLAKEHNTNHFVLKETKVPDGYRQPAEVRLRLENGVIFSEDSWSTGTYAQAKVTTTAPSEVKYKGGTLNLANLGTELEHTIMFAVIFKRVDMNEPIGDEDNWVPVYGDAMSGWHVMENRHWSSVLQAAENNQYLFHVATNGSFQVEIDDLPGDVKEYYSMLEEGDENQARYTVAYYYTEANSLQGATEENTHRLNTDDFLREFSVKLFIPNPRNRLVVQKVDDGHPLSGAGFALYAAEDITTENDGTYEIVGNAEPYDTVKTADLTKESGSWLELEGAGVFPTGDKDLENGTYYLVESEPPTGYTKNPTAVKVIVDDTGVYADAGSEDDGVSVQRGVGRLMRSMLQFAANDDIDATLHDVKAQLLTAQEEPSEAEWTEWNDSLSRDSELHLRYDSADETLAYVPADGFTKEYLSTETGWSKLEIRQCLAHADDLGDAYKQDLGEKDLSNLFSGVVIVQVEDKKTSEGTSALEVTKYVKGTGADTNQNFDFTVQLDKPLNGWYGDMFFENGTAAFALSDDKTMTATGLPDGTGYTVTETDAEGYEVTYTNQSGTLKDDQTAEVIVTNTKETPAPEPEPETGSLTVSKIVVDEAGGYLPDDTAEFHFEITLTGADSRPINGDFSYTGGTVQGVSGVIAPDGGTLEFENGTASITLKHGQTITINGLPAGAAYSVIEDTASGYEVERGTVSGTIQAETENSAAFTNIKVDDPGPGPEPDPGNQTGSLTVSKKVEGDGDQNKDFKFQITLTGENGQPLSGTFYYDGAKTGTIQSGGAIALKHGESITIHGIPAGTAYQVEELDADGYKVTSEGTAGTIRAEGTVTAAFTNTRNDDPGPGPDPDPDPDDPIGNLTLSKTVRGDDRNGTFTFRVTFTTKTGGEITARFYYNGDKTGTIGSGETVTLADGESITIRNIPAGTHYQVEELNAEGYDVTSSGETGSITESKTAQASFVNTWNDTPDQPTDPEGPNDPDGPHDPDIPPDPDIPDDPNEPNTPDDPNDPGTPDDPGEPGTPDDPGQPDEPDVPNDPGTPKTDDPRHTSLWIALCLLSLGGMGVLAFTRNGIKRKKR